MQQQRRRPAVPREVAGYLGMTEGALAQMRYRGTGPAFIKAGPRKVLYRWEDVDAWLDQGKRTITGNAA